MFISVIIK